MQSNDLKSFEKTPWLFVFTSQGVDHFRVVIPDGDLAVNDELADVYWDIFDRYPDYDFVISRFRAVTLTIRRCFFPLRKCRLRGGS